MHPEEENKNSKQLKRVVTSKLSEYPVRKSKALTSDILLNVSSSRRAIPTTGAKTAERKILEGRQANTSIPIISCVWPLTRFIIKMLYMF